MDSKAPQGNGRNGAQSTGGKGYHSNGRTGMQRQERHGRTGWLWSRTAGVESRGCETRGMRRQERKSRDATDRLGTAGVERRAKAWLVPPRMAAEDWVVADSTDSAERRASAGVDGMVVVGMQSNGMAGVGSARIVTDSTERGRYAH